MDDLKILFWIILGLIYIFARKKKKDIPPPSSTAQRDTQREEAPEPAPKSFDEMLREIQQMKAPAREPVSTTLPTPRREPEYVDYDDDIEEEKTDQDKYIPDYRKQDKIYQIYDDAKNQAFERPSLEETSNLSDTIVRFKQFKEYEIEEKEKFGEELRKELTNPRSFKKAFLLKEILDRKY
ncbi:MAG: hypothetical protein SH819_02655 [Cytophagales bacterium]|nr:hypothetical protein [Cytophagales bacterium]